MTTRKAAWHDGNRWRGVFNATPGFQNRITIKVNGQIFEFEDVAPYKSITKWGGGVLHFEQSQIDECWRVLVRQEQANKDALAAREAFKQTLGYKIAALSAVDTEQAGEQWNKLSEEKLKQIISWLNETGTRV